MKLCSDKNIKKKYLGIKEELGRERSEIKKSIWE